MDYGSIIDKIMKEVKDGSTEPFIIYRDKDGDWHSDFTQNQYGDTFDWVEDIKDKDHLALTFKGSDFANGSFPYVYDKVLAARIREEYYVARSSGRDSNELNTLAAFVIDNIGEFSQQTTDYLMKFDRPLATLQNINPLRLSSDTGAYDESKAEKLIEIIENKIAEWISRDNDEIKAGYSDKREIEGYTEKISVNLAEKTVVFAENQKADDYLICNIKYDNPLNMEERYDAAVTNDYVEAMREFAKRIDDLAVTLETERQKRGLPFVALTANDCVPGGLDTDLTNKVIIIKSEALIPEYRSADYQVKIAMGGFGAKPDSRGSAVFCKDVYSGGENRFERLEVLGVADMERLPEWAKQKLAEMDSSKDARAGEPPQKAKNADKKPSLLGKLDGNKQKVERNKSERKDKPVTKKTGDLEVN